MEQKDRKQKAAKEKMNIESNPYAQFADQVKHWNRLRKSEGLILGLFGVVGCCMVAILEILGAGLGSSIAIVFAVFFGMLIAWMHCEIYVRVDGKGNRLNQYIYDVPLLMAFSMKDYYKEIEKRLWKKTLVVSGIVFTIIFVFSVVSLFKDFFRVIGLCAMTVAVMDIAIMISFFFLRYFNMRSFLVCIEKGKSKKLVSPKKASFWSEHPVLLVLLCVISSFGSVMFVGVRDYILRVPNDIEAYRSASDWFIMIYIIIMCGVHGGEQIGKLVTKKGGSIKQVACLGVLAVISIIYGCTFHTTYYEDKIVANRFLLEKEYAWDEVQSYTVKPKWISGILQLELEMDDRTLWVISSNYICSEKHYDDFGDDYEYIAHLLEKMEAYGISGTLEDEEKIAPDPEFHDEESIEAFGRIKDAIYGE